MMDPTILMHDLGMIPDRWQARVLRSQASKVLLLCGRQQGKSTVSALKALHRGLYFQGSLVLIVAPTERQSSETFLKVLDAWNALGRPVGGRDLKLSLELDNDSRIIALPGIPKTIRGFSDVSMVILDEAAQVSDAMIAAVSPMVAVSGGQRMMLSTPYGRRGVFFSEWDSGDPSWVRIRARASECPRISPEFLAGERRTLGERLYNQEYETEFIMSDDQVFSADSIDDAFDSDLLAIKGF